MDKRRHERLSLGDKGWQAALVDQVSGATLGTVVNLSPAGMMLITSHAMGVESLHQVECIATGPAGQNLRFSLGTLVLWQTQASQQDTYWAGLQIIDIDEPSQNRLASLSADMAADD